MTKVAKREGRASKEYSLFKAKRDKDAELALTCMRPLKDIYQAASPFAINRVLEYDLMENWNDGAAEYGDCDVITRRYLEYCLVTGQEIEDCVTGLNQGKARSSLAIPESIGRLIKQRARSSSPENYESLQSKRKGQSLKNRQPMLKEDGTENSLEKSAFNLDGEFDEITRQNSILSKEEIRHL